MTFCLLLLFWLHTNSNRVLLLFVKTFNFQIKSKPKIDFTFPLPHVFPQPPFPLKREPTASAPRGATLSTRINKYRSLVMSLRFVRQLRNNTAQSLVLFRQARRSYSRRRCGSHPEYAHTVYKYALNECSFVHNPNHVWISSHQVRYHRACTISSRGDIIFH